MEHRAIYIPHIPPEQETPIDPPAPAPEWEVDEWGRRFKRIGGMIEYEMMVTIDGMQIPESEVADYHRRKKEREEQQRRAAMEAARNAPPRRECPFAFNGGFTHDCTREKCAVFDGGACGLSHLAETAPTATKGRKCPFSSYPCREDCALYKSGCILAALNKERNNNNE